MPWVLQRAEPFCPWIVAPFGDRWILTSRQEALSSDHLEDHWNAARKAGSV